jgi:predicted GTPase
MGYSDRQRHELEATIEAIAPDAVIIGTPIDLEQVIDLGDIPRTRARYSLEEIGSPTLADVLASLGG